MANLGKPWRVRGALFSALALILTTVANPAAAVAAADELDGLEEQAGVSLSGTVQVPAGYEPGAVTVEIVDADDESDPVSAVEVSPDGSWQVEGLEQKDYKVQFLPDVEGLVGQWWESAESFESATVVRPEDGQPISGISASLTAAPTPQLEIPAEPDPDGERAPALPEANEPTEGPTKQAPRATPPAAAAFSSMGSISGKVTVPAGEDPENVYIDVYELDEDELDWADSTVADSDGTYRFTGLDAGTYVIEFQSNNWNGANMVPQWWNGKSNWESATPIVLTAGASKSNINATMKKGAVITGKVTVPAGENPSSVSVSAYDASDEDGPRYVASAAVAPNGSYTIGGLLAGTYVVNFEPDVWSGVNMVPQWWNGKSDWESATLIVLTDGGAKANIDATLRKGAVISGTVGVPSGQDPQDVSITVYRADEEVYVTYIEAASDGTYKVAGLPAGNYKVQFSSHSSSGGGIASQWWNGKSDWESATQVTLTDGGEKPGINATMAKGASISGNVTVPAGEDPEEVSVWVYNASGNYAGMADVARDGTYEVGGLPAGTYKVQFHVSYWSEANITSQWWNGKADKESATPIVLAAGASKLSVNATMTSGATISGKVTVPSGEDPEDVYVQVYDSEYDWVASADVQSNGTYEVKGLEPGTYRLEFASYSEGGSNMMSQWWDGKADWESATPIVLAAGASKLNVDATMTSGATISGKVKVPAGQDPADVSVIAYSTSGTEFLDYWTYAEVEQDGTYAIRGLPAGTYLIHFYSDTWNGANMVSQWWDGKDDAATATPIVLAAGASKLNVDATMTKGASVSGKVTVPLGEDPSNVRVEVNDIDGDVASSVVVAPDGAYEAVGLPAGTYKVMFEPLSWTDANMLSQWWNGKSDWESATPIVLAANESRSGINATMRKGASISGKVTVPAGQDPGAIAVAVVDLNNDQTVAYTEVESDGTYSIGGLTEGTYGVEFTPDSWYGANMVTQWWNGKADIYAATPIVLGAAEAKIGIDVTMVKGSVISGKVTVPSGELPEDVLVTVLDSKDRSRGDSGTLAQDGTYQIVGLAAGTYKVEFSKVPWSGANILSQWWDGKSDWESATPVTLAAGAARKDVNADMAKGATITGSVSLPNDEWPDSVSVELYDLNGKLVDDANLEERSGGSRYTYRFSGLAPGTYKVLFVGVSCIADQWWNGAMDFQSADTVTVSGTQTKSGIDVDLECGATIEGAVTVPSGYSPGDVKVIVYNSLGKEVAEGSFYLAGLLSNQYRVDGLIPGSYKVKFMPRQQDLALSWWNGATTFEKATPITVTKQEQKKGINISLSKGAKVTGTIGATGSSATAKVTNITAYRWETDKWSVVQTITGWGNYTMGSLPAGDYKIGFGAPDEDEVALQGKSYPYCDQFWNNQTSLASANQFTVAANGVQQAVNASLATECAQPQVQPGNVTVTGAGVVGSTVKVAKGTWGPSPVNMSVQWLVADKTVTGATGDSYTVAAADVGKKLSVRVTGTKTGYSTASKTVVVTDKVGAGTLSVGTPAVSGVPQVGFTLTATPGTWTAGASLSYQWLRSGQQISGATSASYKPVAADVGNALSVRVTGNMTGYSSAYNTSAPTGAVVAAAKPTISGTARVGLKLTASPGVWSSGVTRTYQWYAGGKVIPGATKSTYTLKATEAGKAIKVAVTGKSGTDGVTRSSANTLKVIAAAKPKVTGTAAVGSKLTAKKGTWTRGTKVTYQWYAGGKAIRGAAKSTYTLKKAQAGKTMTVKATGTLKGYPKVTMTSAKTKKVKKTK